MRGHMHRWAVMGVMSVASLSWSVSSAEASTLDPSGKVVFAGDALAAFDFEDGPALADRGGQITGFRSSPAGPILDNTAGGDLTPFIEALAVPLEGSSALKLGAVGAATGRGVVIIHPDLFASLTKKRIEISMWARAVGARPQLLVLYGQTSWPLDLGYGWRFANVVGVETGRATSDGWVELSTGPIDGDVLDVPIRGIAMIVAGTAGPLDSAYVDALEIRPAAGNPPPAAACTLGDRDTTCGADGDCVFGRCVPSWVTWGPLPPAAHRRELVDGYVTALSNIQGARELHAAVGKAASDTRARALAATSSRTFFEALQELATDGRNGHTRLSPPPSVATLFSPIYTRRASFLVGGCFGEIEADLLGGGRRFGILATSGGASTMKVGDVLTSVDGEDPKAWLDKHRHHLHSVLSDDPRHDDAQDALALAWMLSTHASTAVYTRCTSATSCAGADRKTFSVDMTAAAAASVLSKGEYPGRNLGITCTGRFRNAVDGFPAFGSEDVVQWKDDGTIVSMEFDGFEGGPTWRPAVNSAIGATKGGLLVDARFGHGGRLDDLSFLVSAFGVGADLQIYATSVRTAWDDPDFGLVLQPRCIGPMEISLGCHWSMSSFYSGTPTPKALSPAAKVALLGGFDVSANDLFPRMLGARPNTRRFAPHATSGSFGHVTDVPPLLVGWGSGSMQASDIRFAPTRAALATAPWESGKGVAPDQVIAQTLSDLLLGTDTLIAAARAWLVAP